MMSRDVVSAVSALTAMLLCHSPQGEWTTKPRSICTGPPIITRLLRNCSGTGLSMAENTASIGIGEGLLMTSPKAPSPSWRHI